MKDFNLYVITDTGSGLGRSHQEIAKRAVEGGADIIQLRDKNLSAKELTKIGSQIKTIIGQNAALIINDRADIALACGADGVHLGQDDLPVPVAREILGAERIIGVSTHSIEQAIDAQAKGADYIAIGPIFSTPTKPDYKAVGLEILEQVRDLLKAPFLAIGGINRDNVNEIIRRGVRRAAFVRAVNSSPDISAAARELKNLLIGCHESHDSL